MVNKNKLGAALLEVSAKLSKLDQKTQTYGTDVPLHEAEIHMIKSIKESEGIHVTGLAEMLGVTKGAVSQIIMKLDKKDMIVKAKDGNNQSRLALKLSEKGETAYLHYEEVRQELHNLIQDSLRGASYENKQFLLRFLTNVNKKLDLLDESKKGSGKPDDGKE